MRCCPTCNRPFDRQAARGGLTRQQFKALTFIKHYVAERGFSPSYDEIKDALGVRSRSGVNRLVNGLQDRGAITFIPNMARSIAIAAPVNSGASI